MGISLCLLECTVAGVRLAVAFHCLGQEPRAADPVIMPQRGDGSGCDRRPRQRSVKSTDDSTAGRRWPVAFRAPGAANLGRSGPPFRLRSVVAERL